MSQHGYARPPRELDTISWAWNEVKIAWADLIIDATNGRVGKRMLGRCLRWCEQQLASLEATK